MKKTFRKLIILLAFPGIACAFTSCDKDDDNDNHTIGNQDFVNRASSSNMFEIAAGSLALQNSTNTDVKAFGNHMVSDHGQTATEMASLVQQKELSVPTTLLTEEQLKLDTLTGLTGSAFDHKFASMMVLSHTKTIALFTQASGDSGVPDDDLRSFASGKLPTLKEHLQEAQQLEVKVGN